MKEVIIAILLLLIINTCLLVYNCNQNKKEGYFNTMDRTTTRVGPYEGITSCSSFGVRNVRDSNLPIGDDSFIFNGPNVSQKMMKNSITMECRNDRDCYNPNSKDETFFHCDRQNAVCSYGPRKLMCSNDIDCDEGKKCVNQMCV
jgi:hypothetical protein